MLYIGWFFFPYDKFCWRIDGTNALHDFTHYIYIYMPENLYPKLASAPLMIQESFNIETIRKYHQDITDLKKNIMKNNENIKMLTTNYYMHLQVQVLLA